MIAIVRNLDRFDGRSSFGTWAYRIATNASLDELRRRKRRAAPDRPTTTSIATTSMPIPTAANGSRRSAITWPSTPRCARSATSTGYRSCSAMSPISTTRKSPKCSTSLPAR